MREGVTIHRNGQVIVRRFTWGQQSSRAAVVALSNLCYREPTEVEQASHLSRLTIPKACMLARVSVGESQRSQRLLPFHDAPVASDSFMASDICPYITGANLVIDGGVRLRPLVLVSDDEIRDMNLQDSEAHSASARRATEVTRLIPQGILYRQLAAQASSL